MRLPRRFYHWLRRDRGSGFHIPVSRRERLAMRPRIHSLEPRVVLNATAELNDLGQLLISGDEESNVITVEINPSEQLIIRDNAGNTIPIFGHPDDPTGPLSVSAITSRQLVVDLGAGDDILELEIPSPLSVRVTGGDGNDSATLKFRSSDTPAISRAIDVDTEIIRIDSAAGSVDLREIDAKLVGAVELGTNLGVTAIQLENSRFEVIGAAQLHGDVHFIGNSSIVDISGATLSSSGGSNDLEILLQGSSDVSLGGTDELIDSASRLANVRVNAASSLSIEGPQFAIDGHLVATDIASSITIDASVTASSVVMDATDRISLTGTITAVDGPLQFDSDRIDLRGSLDASLSDSGRVRIFANELHSTDASIFTAGGDIVIESSVYVSGRLILDSSRTNTLDQAGNVLIEGVIDSIEGGNGILNVKTFNDEPKGSLIINGEIGPQNRLQSMTLQAAAVTISKTDLVADLKVNAVGTSLLGSIESRDGVIDVQGTLVIGEDNLIIAGSDVNFGGLLTSNDNTQSLSIRADQRVTFEQSIANLNNLAIESGGTIEFQGPVSIRGNLDADATRPIQISTSSIRTTGTQSFEPGVLFLVSGELNASEVSLGEVVDVIEGQTYRIQATVVGTHLNKAGEGTLVIAGESTVSDETRIESGTLRIDGTLSAIDGTVRIVGGRLEGDGSIEGHVVVESNGILSPGSPLGAISFGSLGMAEFAVAEFRFDVTRPDPRFDQIVISQSGGTVSIESSLIDFEFTTLVTPGTEFIIVRNDGQGAITGTWSTLLNVDGTTQTQARDLTEGSMVLQDFGGSGRPGYITYFGGDGNDVAIVTAGDQSVTSGPFNLIQRNGINIEIRQGDDLSSALMSAPIIRPIAAINDYRVQIVGSSDDEVLMIDVDEFYDGRLDGIEYSGQIEFVGGGLNDHDLVSLVDLGVEPSESLHDVSYSINSAYEVAIDVTVRESVSSFSVVVNQVESIDQRVDVESVTFNYSDQAERIVVTKDMDSPELTQVNSSTVDGLTSISIQNPLRSLTLLSASGDDSIVVEGFGESGGGFSASLLIDGQDGDDIIQLDSSLNLGRFDVEGSLDLRAERMRLRGSIDTTGGLVDGQIRLFGGDAIVIENDAVLDAGDASILVNAAGGEVDLSAATLISTNINDSISLLDGTLVRLGNVQTFDGHLTIVSSEPMSGITQASGTTVLIDRLEVNVIGSVGLANSSNEIRAIESVVARGFVEISDSADNLDVVSVRSSGDRVQITASGDMRLEAEAIVASMASVSLMAGGAILDARPSETSAVSNVIANSIQLAASDGGIGAGANALVVEATSVINASTLGSNDGIFLSSPAVNFPIGLVHAGSGTVSIDAFAISDAMGDAIVDIVANSVVLNAVNGIGSVDAIELSGVSQIIGLTESGGIRLTHESDGPLRVRELTAVSGTINLTHSGPGLLSVEKILNSSSDVLVRSLNGSIAIVGDGIDPVSVFAGMHGQVSIIAQGADSDIVVEAGVGSLDGSTTLAADSDLRLNRGGDVFTSTGNITLAAVGTDDGRGGMIVMNDGTSVSSDDGEISINAGRDIFLSSVATQNKTDEAVLVRSRNGRIVDNGDDAVDLIVDRGVATLIASNGIGVDNAIETSLRRLVADVSSTGGIEIEELNDIELRSITTADGKIVIRAVGTIVANEVVSINRDRRDDQPGSPEFERDIRLTTTGSTSDILVSSIRAENGADVFLVAGDDVLDTDPNDGRILVTDDLSVIANNGEADSFIAIQLTTDVSDFTLAVHGRNAGDVFINELNSINLAASDAGSDLEKLMTSNGRIFINAGGAILIQDTQSVNDTETLRGDVEVSANGERGRVSLVSTERIELTGATQIEASLAFNRSVLIEAPSIVLGSQFQMLTGQGLGVARWFSPRPQAGFSDTAFYDSTTVSTNRLTQSGANDAFGELSMLIGKPGENGFTINIDWGDSQDPGYRFEQIDDLPGGETFSQRHIYREADILNSTLNDRESATAPLQVRFSVRHHESILVIGDTIQQGDATVESVAGRLISSTDNPLTQPLLESGTATFTIPNLTIPVAFIPVREIIPEPIEPEVFVRTETSSFFTSGTVESISASTSSSIGRDEYLQIRVLSLEPGGDDLTEPQRLPDDVLSGNNLQKLFDNLPDGRYEIQYVLGDGNERMLLRFDLRNHQPIVPGDDLEGTQIKLKSIDLEAIEQELRDLSEEDDLESTSPSQGDQPSLDGKDEDSTNNESPRLISGMTIGAMTATAFSRRNLYGRKSSVDNPWSFAGRFRGRYDRAQ